MKRQPRVLLVFVAISLLCAAPALAGGIYKWTDADGRVHFGDQPKTNDAKEVTVEDAPPIQLGTEDAAELKEMATRRQQLKNQAKYNRTHLPSTSAGNPNRRETGHRATPLPSNDTGWRQKAIDSCKSGGFRKGCETEEQIQKRRPLTEERRELRREKRMKKIRRQRNNR